MFKNHPKGLAVIFFTEMWERFGFYTMMAVFTLYMDETLHMSDAVKGNIYGLFLAGVYFTPIFGGWIADQWLGHKDTLRLGALVMAVGYAVLAFSGVGRMLLFYFALVLIAAGNGLFKVNTSVLVGNLYPPGSPLKDVGYNIFYMGVNVGAFIAPLAATLLHHLFHSYNVSFGAASAGLVLAILIFELGKRAVLYADNVPRISRTEEENLAVAANDPAEDRQRVFSLIILFLISIFFWAAFYQNGFALTLFAQRSTVKLSWLKPETYQAFDPLFILLLTPVIVGLFDFLRTRGKEPPTPAKIFLGMLVSGFSMLIMVAASKAGGDLDRNIMSPAWLIGTYFVVTVSELLVSPIGLSFVSKVSPARIRGLMMGFWFAATAIGSYASGLFGSFYGSMPHHQYFLLLAGMLFFASFLVLLAMKPLKRFAG